MKSKMIWGNFSVKDAARTNQFYTALGFAPNKSSDPKLASFRFADNDFIIHFFEEGSQIDEFIPARSGNAGEIMFTLSAETEEEVNEFAENVKTAGGSIFKDVQRDEKGYYGFGFADPDGHKFNVLLMDNM